MTMHACKENDQDFITEPLVNKTLSAFCDVDDHNGTSGVTVVQWPDGDGYTVTVTDHIEHSMRLTNNQWRALKMCIKTLQKTKD